VISTQIANLVPTAFLITWVFSGKYKDLQPRYFPFAFVYLPAVIISILLAVYFSDPSDSWKIQLLLLIGASGAVGAMSNIVCWPFVTGNQNGNYSSAANRVVAYSLGNGLSSVFPLIVASIQLRYDFGIGNYFISMSSFLVISLAMISVISFRKINNGNFLSSPDYDQLKEDEEPLFSSPYNQSDEIENYSFLQNPIKFQIYAQIASCFLNFILPGLSNLLVLQKSELDTMILLGMLSGSLARLVVLNKRVLQFCSSRKSIISLVSIQFVIELLAVLVFSSFGSIPNSTMEIILSVILNFIFGLVSTSLYTDISEQQMSSMNKERCSRYLGAAEQIGAAGGAILSYVVSRHIFSC
jgi:hypothetical protein